MLQKTSSTGLLGFTMEMVYIRFFDHNYCAARSVTKSEGVSVQQTGAKAHLGSSKPGGLRDPLGGDLDHLEGLGLGYDHLAAGVEQHHRQWAPCPTRPSFDSSPWSKAFPVTLFNFGGMYCTWNIDFRNCCPFSKMSNWPQTIVSVSGRHFLTQQACLAILIFC